MMFDLDLKLIYCCFGECNAYHTKCKLTYPPIFLKIADFTASGFAEWWSKVHIIDNFDQYINLLISSTCTTLAKKANQRKELVDTQLSGVKHGKGKVLVIGPSNDNKDRASKRKSTQLTQEVIGMPENQHVVFGNNIMIVDNLSDETSIGSEQKLQRLADQVGNSEARHSSQRTVLLECSTLQVNNQGMGGTCENNVVKPHPKALPLSAPEFTKFSADKVIEDGQLKLALILWESIQFKIARTPFDQIHLLINKVHKIFAVIEGIKAVDSSALKGRVEEYFSQIAKFIDLESSFSSRMSSKDQKEISALQEKKAKLESFLKENEKALEVVRADVSHIREEMASAESCPILNEADANASAESWKP
ncbi:hypothetical protein CCACVL1_24811 [Corchorus capsularis]|uniref:Uncharacterized protein n=1 Tax=Corchorus capsularis TaxID=210143 RepID=A0A1R3GN15_COCAP|nr:hypothetical protein CCACVL1_24811 [Corchorus capsularis]